MIWTACNGPDRLGVCGPELTSSRYVMVPKCTNDEAKDSGVGMMHLLQLSIGMMDRLVCAKWDGQEERTVSVISAVRPAHREERS